MLLNTVRENPIRSECHKMGMSVSAVARKYDISPSQLFDVATELLDGLNINSGFSTYAKR